MYLKSAKITCLKSVCILFTAYQFRLCEAKAEYHPEINKVSYMEWVSWACVIEGKVPTCINLVRSTQM